MGFTGLTVSIVAVVLYLLALLRLRVSIRLLHPGQKNPPPPPPMVIQNVEDIIISVKGPGGRGGLQPHTAPPPPPPQILGSKRRFGQSQVLKTFPCFFNYFEEINIFYFNLKKILKSP